MHQRLELQDRHLVHGRDLDSREVFLSWCQHLGGWGGKVRKALAGHHCKDVVDGLQDHLGADSRIFVKREPRCML